MLKGVHHNWFFKFFVGAIGRAASAMIMNMNCRTSAFGSSRAGTSPNKAQSQNMGSAPPHLQPRVHQGRLIPNFWNLQFSMSDVSYPQDMLRDAMNVKKWRMCLLTLLKYVSDYAYCMFLYCRKYTIALHYSMWIVLLHPVRQYVEWCKQQVPWHCGRGACGETKWKEQHLVPPCTAPPALPPSDQTFHLKCM